MPVIEAIGLCRTYRTSTGVVRRKRHSATPMTVDDALYEMELVGHDFYLFADATSGLPSVVYRRHGFDYVADQKKDLPIFSVARETLLVGPSRALLKKASAA